MAREIKKYRKIQNLSPYKKTNSLVVANATDGISP